MAKKPVELKVVEAEEPKLEVVEPVVEPVVEVRDLDEIIGQLRDAGEIPAEISGEVTYKQALDALDIPKASFWFASECDPSLRNRPWTIDGLKQYLGNVKNDHYFKASAEWVVCDKTTGKVRYTASRLDAGQWVCNVVSQDLTVPTLNKGWQIAVA